MIIITTTYYSLLKGRSNLVKIISNNYWIIYVRVFFFFEGITYHSNWQLGWLSRGEMFFVFLFRSFCCFCRVKKELLRLYVSRFSCIKKSIDASISTLCHQHVTKKNERGRKERIMSFFFLLRVFSSSTLRMIDIVSYRKKVAVYLFLQLCDIILGFFFAFPCEISHWKKSIRYCFELFRFEVHEVILGVSFFHRSN